MRPNIQGPVNKNILSYILYLGHMCTYTYIQAKSKANADVHNIALTIPIKIWQKSSGWNLKENTFKQGEKQERNCKSEGGNLSLEIQQEDKVTEKTWTLKS